MRNFVYTEEESPGPGAYGAGYTVYLNAYRTWRSYGGPEEGGWHYTSGECLAVVPMIGILDKRKLGDYRDETGGVEAYFVDPEKLKLLEEHLRDVCTRMDADEDVCDVEVRLEFGMGRDFPQQRPHYE